MNSINSLDQCVTSLCILAVTSELHDTQGTQFITHSVYDECIYNILFLQMI